MAKPKPAAGNGDRKPDGRFRKGHSVKSPGNPMIRALAAFQSAVSEAFTPTDLVDVLTAMRDLSMGRVGEGGVAPSITERIAAARVWVERVAGKPAEQSEVIPPGILDFELETAADSLKAAQQIAKAAADGRLSLGAAAQLKQLLDIVDKRELVTIAERLDRIEAKEQGAA